MRYEGSVYRPPSEARSWILQATIGCSHNKCTFCSMYKDKSFRIRSTDEIIEEIHEARNAYGSLKRIFIADGDALMIKTEELLQIIKELRNTFPECERIGIYSSPRSINLKSKEELVSLKEAGLGIAYLGLESGSDNILENVKKGDDREGIISAGKKIKDSGLLLSVTVISGLGGKENWIDHAKETASAVNEIKPDYLGLLTLMIEPETELWNQVESGAFSILTPYDIAKETLLMLENLDCPGCVFRSNHASNYVSLKGTLNQDRKEMIKTLENALNDGDFKEEWMRRL
ncbi:radical SAM protein [Gudongella sp. DL1XJH-153]|uniref:radical SAM protein n=1 Tax=Gudongella sp. DL1XJH-153 TaxID=3409804 RepID=UPI003BB6E396